ncbi:MAG: hypothetical protein IH571_00560 [Acholeplasmataceae bacterium]|nr:hypothetical protein [Acholeplasmataceae bacterium]
MKKILSLMLIVFLTSLSACIKNLPTDPVSLDAVFAEMTIDLSTLMATNLSIQQDYSIDTVIFYDARDSEAVKIHVIVSSENTDMQADFMMMITPLYLYSTKTMRKTTHGINLQDQAAYEAYMLELTEWIDLSFFIPSHLKDLSDTLINHQLTRVQKTYRLEAMVPNFEGERVRFIFELSNKQLKEFHERHEADFESTKQRNNYLYGSHFYFSDEIDIDFPSLFDFQ